MPPFCLPCVIQVFVMPFTSVFSSDISRKLFPQVTSQYMEACIPASRLAICGRLLKFSIGGVQMLDINIRILVMQVYDYDNTNELLTRTFTLRSSLHVAG